VGPGTRSVSIIVFVAGAGVSVTVSMIVAPACPSTAVAAAGPPSTGTTEYVALLTKGSSQTAFRAKKGNDEPNEKSEEIAKRIGVDVLSRILKLTGGMKTGSQGLILAVRDKDGQSMEREFYQDQEMHHNICGFPMALALREVGILWKGWWFERKCDGWKPSAYEILTKIVRGFVSLSFKGWSSFE